MCSQTPVLDNDGLAMFSISIIIIRVVSVFTRTVDSNHVPSVCFGIVVTSTCTLYSTLYCRLSSVMIAALSCFSTTSFVSVPNAFLNAFTPDYIPTLTGFFRCSDVRLGSLRALSSPPFKFCAVFVF